MLLGLLALTACAPPPRPFQHDNSEAPVRQLPQDKVELAIAPPRNMPPAMANRVAAALAIELQSYGIVAATVQPAPAPIQVSGTVGAARCRRDRHRDPDRLAHRRQAEFAGPRPPAARARDRRTMPRRSEPAGVAHRPAGRSSRGDADRQAADLPGALARPGRCRHERAGGSRHPMPQRPMAAANPPGSAPAAPTQQQQHVRVMVAEVTGAPSDGNRQLDPGMRRALGSSKIVIVDAAGPDVFTVVGTVSLMPDRRR